MPDVACSKPRGVARPGVARHLRAQSPLHLRRIGPAGRHDLVRYIGVTVVAQGFSYGLFLGLLAASPTLPPLVALGRRGGTRRLLSFAGQRLFTFRGD